MGGKRTARTDCSMFATECESEFGFYSRDSDHVEGVTASPLYWHS